MTITITIEGVAITPKWNTLQKAIGQMLDTEGRIVRIARPDGSCDYRKAGRYEVEFCPEPTGDMVYVDLVVKQ